ncbi:uncharacterized protein LOC116197257 [Punica granatum]|uniref:Uncharacterized protein LOC116197257 n=1 Tax=Punica granatum TaxID=22663 RepID=A0A6P8CJ17_PUNGR|nr:uncharacterized protein LOC116197257 [Punica granatum]
MNILLHSKSRYGKSLLTDLRGISAQENFCRFIQQALFFESGFSTSMLLFSPLAPVLQLFAAIKEYLLLIGDSKGTVNGLLSPGLFQHPACSSLISVMLQDLALFSSWSALYSPGAENFIAHNIARWASFCNTIAIFSIPPDVLVWEGEM